MLLNSLRRISPTTTASGPTRRARVATTRHVWPARRSRRCLLFQRPSILTVGSCRWTSKLLRERSVPGASLAINHQDYYVSRSLAGQRVTCWVNAAEKCFDIWQPGGRIKSVPIKGWYGKTMPFQDYVVVMKREARSEYRQYLRTHHRLAQGRLWA